MDVMQDAGTNRSPDKTSKNRLFRFVNRTKSRFFIYVTDQRSRILGSTIRYSTSAKILISTNKKEANNTQPITTG
jgi:hypothetical protein